MYVCICKGITCGEIKQAVQNGACSMGEVRDLLGVGTQCGKCGKDAKALVKDTITSAEGDVVGFYRAP